MTRTELEAEVESCQAAIDNAYWTFVHCKRGKPPILAVPDAYRRLREIKSVLRGMP